MPQGSRKAGVFFLSFLSSYPEDNYQKQVFYRIEFLLANKLSIIGTGHRSIASGINV